jgi:hypothetical protein
MEQAYLQFKVENGYGFDSSPQKEEEAFKLSPEINTSLLR